LDKKSSDIENLSRKLNVLISKQDVISKEINDIKSALEILRNKAIKGELKARFKETPEEGITEKPEPLQKNEAIDKAPLDVSTDIELAKTKIKDKVEVKSPKTFSLRVPESIQSNLEDFIGTNLINKIGIVVLIIGIGIGAKFAIDRNLISPMIRLILGYLLGSALLFFASRLKKNYHNFSAVLCSGSMAILYFMTYAGIVYFNIISLTVAFTLMVIITAYTVYQSFGYDRQVIAIIGLVGAYAIPFLIGGDPDAYVFLFSYIVIINLGILLVAIRKYWKLLYYIAFASTWIIFALWWFETDGMNRAHFQSSIIFSSIFFLIFYISFLINKVLKSIKSSIEDVILIIGNSFIFYGIGYVSYNVEMWKDNLGLFTMINASIHLLAWVLLYYRRERDENLLLLITGLVITFITIAIPVQFDGYWVTLLWFVEGALLFTAGRTRNAVIYEYFSYAIMTIAIYSLLDDWRIAFIEYASLNYETTYNLIFNLNFLEGLIIIGCLSFVNYINYHPKFPVTQNMDPGIKSMIQYYLTGALVLVAYYTFRLEIAIHFSQLYADSTTLPVSADSTDVVAIRNEDIRSFKNIWILIYSMAFFSMGTLLNIIKIKNGQIGVLSLIVNGIVLLVFLFQGLLILSDLRETYLIPVNPDHFVAGIRNILVRYLAILIFIYVVVINYWLIRQKFMKLDYKIYLDLFTCMAALWILSSELFHWLDFGGYTASDKLGLSILWGVFSLQLIIIGIWRKLKYLRIAAISLFGITLIKLCFYDISGMDTISKTIVFILLGILLLIISFLYNKYRKIIF
jgi:uncharacterized membrane protein